jgi:glycerophosphoryl diester phosphodiesterase
MTPIPFKKLARGFLMIGHRGASGYAPENTFAAFEAAIRKGADMIELDIQLTSDSQWVVIHDLSLKRTCGLSKKVRHIPLSRIKSLDAGSWFSNLYSGETVPTLVELLAWAKKRINLNIEIKGSIRNDDGEIRTLLTAISRYKMVRNVILSSFDWKILRKIRSLHKTIPVGVLVHREPRFLYMREAIDLKAFSVHLPRHKFNKNVADQIHKHKLKVYLYTVNQAKEIEKYSTLGADGLFSNYPDLKVTRTILGSKSDINS